MNKAFKFHKLNDEGQLKAQAISEKYSALLDNLIGLLQQCSPELTIATRKLEESCFYAKKAMARQERHQQSVKEQS